jgi:hypothetical protein
VPAGPWKDRWTGLEIPGSGAEPAVGRGRRRWENVSGPKATAGGAPGTQERERGGARVQVELAGRAPAAAGRAAGAGIGGRSSRARRRYLGGAG